MCPDPSPGAPRRRPGSRLSLTSSVRPVGQAAIPAASADRSTSQLRGVTGGNGGYLTTVYLESNTATPFVPAANFSRLCVYPFPGLPGPTVNSEVKFTCGNG